MKVFTWNQFHRIFHCMCLVITLGMASLCVLKFLKNENLSSLDYKKFHQNKSDHYYPSITLCVMNPFLSHKLKKYGQDINISSYSYFLQGLYWDDRMPDVDYDNVTVSIFDNLETIGLGMHDGVGYRYYPPFTNPFRTGKIPNFYVSFRSPIRKCFTFDVPFMEDHPVFIFFLKVTNEFFVHGYRPPFVSFNGSNPDVGSGFMVYFHYPGQRITSMYTIKYEWEPKRNNSKPYDMKFEVKDVEIIRHRNRPQDPCITDWRNYDPIMRDDIIKKAGCRPPHWTTSQNLPLCSAPNQMAHFRDEKWNTKIESFGPPCNVIDRLQYSYKEKEHEEGAKLVPYIN